MFCIKVQSNLYFSKTFHYFSGNLILAQQNKRRRIMASNSEKLYLKKILSSYLLKIELMFKRKIKMGLEELMNKLASSHLGPGGKESHQYISNIPIDTVFRPIRTHQYGSIHQIWFCSWRGLNHESLDYESNTLTTAPSNPDDLVMN